MGILYDESQVKQALTARAADFNILLDDVALTHLSFGDEVGVCITQHTLNLHIRDCISCFKQGFVRRISKL
jgi:hypothetical protein